MKTIALILTLACLPILGFAQKGHGKEYGHGGNSKHNENGRGNHGDYIHENHKPKHYKESKTVAYNNNHYYKSKHKHYPNPYWAPDYGYNHRHVYFPEYGCYYDTYTGMYIYREGPVWVTSVNVPTFMVHIGTCRKVVIDLDYTPSPQIYFQQHISIYR